MSKKPDNPSKTRPPSRVDIKQHPNGEIETATPYVNGKKHGVETWWEEDGTKEREETWRNGRRHGMETEWYENGRKRQDTMWKDGEKHGLSAWWDEAGKKEREIYYTRKKIHAGMEWDEEGNVISLTFPTPPIKTPASPPRKNGLKNQIK